MKRIKQTELAKMVGVSPTFIGYVLAGKCRPGLSVAKKLEEATGINRLAWLYPDEHKNPMMRAASERQE